MADEINPTLAGIARQVFDYVRRTIDFAKESKDDITKRCRLSRAVGALEAIKSFAGGMTGYAALSQAIQAAWPPKPQQRERSYGYGGDYDRDEDELWAGTDGDPSNYGDN